MAEVSIHTTIWMNPEIMMISETSQNKKPHIVWFYLHEISRMDKAIENSDVQGLGRGENGKKWFNGYRVLRWSDGTVLELD